MITRISKLNSL